MRFLAFILFVGVGYNSFSQSGNQGSNNQIQLERFYLYTEVIPDWNMDGSLQLLLNEGINNLREGNIDIALSNFSDFTKSDSTNWITLYYQGICYKITGDFVSAEKYFLKASMLKKNYEITMELGKVQRLKSNFKEAIRYYEEAIQIKPSHPETYFLLGEIALTQGNSKLATQYLTTCLKKDATYSDAKIQLALIEILKSKDPTSGLRFLNEILEKDSLNRSALVFRGLINFNDKPRKSLNDFTKLVRLNPSNPMMRYYRALLLIRLENYDLAFRDLRILVQSSQYKSDRQLNHIHMAASYTYLNIYGLQDQIASKIRKSFCLFFIGDHQKSIETLLDIKKEDQSALSCLLLALNYDLVRKDDLSYQFYQQTLALDPEKKDILFRASKAAINCKKWERAEGLINECLKQKIDTLQLMKLRGIARFNQNNFAGSIEDFSTYLKRFPNDEAITMEYAKALQKTGKYLSSINHFLSTKNYRAFNQLALRDSINSLVAKGDTTQALMHLRSYISITPEFFYARVMIVSIMIEKKLYNDADREILAALRCAENVQNLHMPFSEIQTARGIISANEGKEQEALQFFESAIEANKSNPRAHYEIAKILIRQGKQKSALKNLKSAYSLGYQKAQELISELEANKTKKQ